MQVRGFNLLKPLLEQHFSVLVVVTLTMYVPAFELAFFFSARLSCSSWICCPVISLYTGGSTFSRSRTSFRPCWSISLSASARCIFPKLSPSWLRTCKIRYGILRPTLPNAVFCFGSLRDFSAIQNGWASPNTVVFLGSGTTMQNGEKTPFCAVCVRRVPKNLFAYPFSFLVAWHKSFITQKVVILRKKGRRKNKLTSSVRFFYLSLDLTPLNTHPLNHSEKDVSHCYTEQAINSNFTITKGASKQRENVTKEQNV